MKILITGICGFAGSTIANALLDHDATLEISGFDNFIRPGSYTNIEPLRERGVRVLHADLRCPSDIESLASVDWIIDAAANASVLAGVDGKTSSRQLVEHNLHGTTNLLEKARRDGAGFVLLSTSRVYSIKALAALHVESREQAFVLAHQQSLPAGISDKGITESFSTAAPVSLYGATKLASEALALEYGEAFGLPIWVNRCGVMAGAGQFGRSDQGIFAYWINAYMRRAPLRYTGFGGDGFQVRDCFHPRDLASLLLQQMKSPRIDRPRILNIGGGRDHAISLAQLSAWCAKRCGKHQVTRDAKDRPFDLPWLIIDPSLAHQEWNWQPSTSLEQILQEIATHGSRHPNWLDLSAP